MPTASSPPLFSLFALSSNINRRPSHTTTHRAQIIRMPTRFDNKRSLALHVVQLNGKLTVSITTADTLVTRYIFQGSDIEATDQIKDARSSAVGDCIHVRGLEVYLEQVRGFLDLRFQSMSGDMLSFQYKGRKEKDSGEIRSQENDGPSKRVEKDGPAKGGGYASGPIPLHLGKDDEDGIQDKMEVSTMKKKTASDESDESEEDINGEEGESNIGAKKLFPKGIVSVFETFNEPESDDTEDTDLQNTLKRPSDDINHGEHRAYKHIFMEGYRTSPGDDNCEGRLHIDLANHEIFWESCDEFEWGTRLIVDRLNLPACKFSSITIICYIDNVPLPKPHHFGDHTLQLCRVPKRSRVNASVAFSMDHKNEESNIWANNTGTGEVRRYWRSA
ncbi:hypothetical protein CC80DRAFT_502551 [Byssothecium circinans]|uniref:Uncharacterized protein n=1 Tax=Byssothecium circinans TaxID=147558 RepID=A0A6A5U1U0_9PLEO|nr:hypothetical protein CC80DRAFT_502551 [Byssothecium circinans]